jgi:hypothetical protein
MLFSNIGGIANGREGTNLFVACVAANRHDHSESVSWLQIVDRFIVAMAKVVKTVAAAVDDVREADT